MKRLLVLASACLVGAAFAASAPAPAPASVPQDPFRVAFLYPTSMHDEGWSQQHDRSRELAEKHFAGKIRTQCVENVKTMADAERVIRDLATQGNQLIFATAFEYMNPALKVAHEFPQVKFELAQGYKTGENLSNYNARLYQARYLSGRLAGSETRSNILGYVASMPTPEVLQGINAFTLGAQAVNPEARVMVVWTNAWYDPGKEADATKTLIGQGADVLTHHTDSQAVAATCETANVKVISYHVAMKKAAPTRLIAAVTHHWDEFYIRRIKEAMNGTWTPDPVWGGAEMHMVRLSDVTIAADSKVVSDIEKLHKRMERRSFEVFAGPIVDNEGNVRIEARKKADDRHLAGMNYFVKGVMGKVPRL